MPCFNEKETLGTCVQRVLKIQDANLSLEVILVDDCSTDGSDAVSRHMANQHPEIKCLRHRINQGKGAALRTGFKHATGEFVAIQDADLELDPMDLKRLLVPLVEDQADVVFGSRFLGKYPHKKTAVCEA